MLHNCGSRVKQQYLCIKENIPVERADMVKGYEFEKDKYVMFTPAELKAMEEAPRSTIDIVSFIPLPAVDPIYYDKAYYLAPDKRGAKPYRLLLEAMQVEDDMPATLFHQPWSRMGLDLLLLNQRDEAARYEPIEGGENAAAFAKARGLDWKAAKYSAIVVPGAAPRTSA